MSTDFVHLHVHTDYSLLDGACKVGELAAQCEAMGMNALAITDHGNMHGGIEFYKTLRGKGIKPILGCEFYSAPGSCHERNPNSRHRQGFHQLLLARNHEGYQNLCRLNAAAYLKGFYFKPRVDKELLAQHSAGLIGTTSCIGSEVCQAILDGDVPKARELMGVYVDILGRENYFIELQDHGMEEQRRVNRVLLDFAKEFNVKVIATNDVHYLEQKHAHPHELLLCIGTQKTMLEDHMKFPSDNFYLKSPEEMAALFSEIPEAITNTRLVAEMCDVTLDFKTNHYPVYATPNGEDRREYLIQLCEEAMAQRYGINLSSTSYESLPDDQKVVVDRMRFEIDVIERMGFVSYFLVVWDFIAHARRVGIPVGPGRGSGAGSIVAYLLRITDIEPLRYNLLFERFLNPDRVSPPDFDIDFCERRRGEVIEYVRDKYGADSVAQICTFGKLKAKAVLKDVARVLGRSFDEGNRLTKLVPADPKMTLDKALEESKEFKEFYDAEDWAREIYANAKPLEGLTRGLGIHAAGVIIGDQPLTNLIPLAKGAGDEVITQFDAVPCEELGLLKMDFLGLRTLTIIQDTCDNIKIQDGIHVDPDEIPLDDPEPFELLTRGETVCVFQLESGGMQDLCRRWHVETIEHIIALIALYRPGPMQFIDEFLDRKFGRKKIDYDVPEMKPILEETYGIMLYQEQVMQVVQKVAGFGLGQADILRRAMGKKKADVMAEQYSKFEEGCKTFKGIDAKVAKAIWDKIETFAGYGFNKSHSAAYGFLAYRTAWLKAKYPVAFMAANMTADMNNAERLSIELRECREMGIEVLPPDVSVSQHNFIGDGENIRFGLAAIKGVGRSAADSIIQARNDGGPFASLQDFCERVDGVNRRLMESLTQCGAFDCFGLRRSQVMAMIEDVITRAQSALRDRQAGQENFFDMLGGDDGGGDLDVAVPDLPEWEPAEKLKYEKELLGFYVTGHPLDEYQHIIKDYGIHTVHDVQDMRHDQGLRIGGLIAGISRKISKRDGRPWAIVTLEDLDNAIEVLVYSETYDTCMSAITDDAPVFVEGHVNQRDAEEKATIVATRVLPIEQAQTHFTNEILVALSEQQVTDGTIIEPLKRLLKDHPGETPVILALHLDDGSKGFVEAGRNFQVRYTPALAAAIRRLLGPDALTHKANRTPPEARRRPNYRDRQPAAS